MSSPISPRFDRPDAPGVDRRRWLAGATAGLAVAALPQAGRAAASEFVTRLTEGAIPETGRMVLEIPALVENGNSVDTRVAVESPMTEADHVRWIHLIAEKNPFPDMARLHLGPRAGRAEVATTLRLAQSQTVIALASLSDGRFLMAQADVVVTLSACIDGG
jgi:sulfur-oxidizing protein SoxY